MQFLYPALTIAFLLAFVPLLIHLINMMRHRRVRWAAMEFLLQSYKKHRKWVWLKQLILLLMRMAAIVLLVAMLAQLVTQRRYEGFFGTTLTHHYVLIDDSYSMSDRVGGTTAFERALKFARQLGSEAANQELRQRFTLVRFSQALAAADESDDSNGPAPQVADLNAADVDSTFPVQLEEVLRPLDTTQLAVGPESCLRVARQLIGQQSDENRVVYVVSDFRDNQWSRSREIRQRLVELERAGAALHLVNCARNQRTNLAITELKPTDETRAAGVPLFMHVSVTNFGPEPEQNVQLKVRTMFHDQAKLASGTLNQPAGELDELPIVQLERIEPGETITRRVQVFFPEPGRHVVEALLPEDPVSVDNRRQCVVELPGSEPVLVIDGDPRQRNQFYLQSIFQPSQRVRTGIEPAVMSVAELRDAAADTLSGYRAIYLFDVARLDERARENLEAYVRGGGGLAFFVGPQVNINFYNEQLYRDGQGLFPLPLARDELLQIDELVDAPDVDVQATDHPVFRELVQGQNPIIRMVRIERFLRPGEEWVPEAEEGVRVLATLRTGAPLAVEKPFGKGRVIAFTTTYAPYWNDIALGPCVVIALRLQAYLGATQRVVPQNAVGQPIPLQVDSSKFQPNVRIFVPSGDPAAPIITERPAKQPSTDSKLLTAAIRTDETRRSGVYEVWYRTLEGSVVADRFAVNVDPQEGNLKLVDSRQLLTALEPLPVVWQFAEQYEASLIEQAGFNQSLLIMVILIGLLLLEQIMAYVASFHPSRRAAGGATR